MKISAAFLFLVLALLLESGLPQPDCPPNMHYDTCAKSCPMTCKNETVICNMMCNQGCVCDKDYVRRCNASDQCVLQSECTNINCP
uniref:Cysteine-rich venom protein 6-like n=1 Tax=Geotrypetes seraphini TaxID=260995 RepID=A0A6P8RIB0_GEOSA|nr:cysteine-rich venom protein 6-like [Geotrypetes seraphini]